MDDYTPRPDMRDTLATLNKHKEATATQAVAAIEQSLFAPDDVGEKAAQLAQRRADAINTVIRAKEHVPGGSAEFSAQDATTAYAIALLLDGTAS
jgi:chemotaxis regulatin CheY-phosphate phosphatase CheZ